MRREPLESQTTIREPVALEGIGLHTGNPVRLTFRPAPPNSGIRFLRADLQGSPAVPARLRFVTTTVRGTNLGSAGAAVHTVEHVLSAATGAGVDNLDVEVTANEPPALDGSALPFYRAIMNAGLRGYPGHPKRCLELPGEVVYQAQGSSYRAFPSDRLEVHATLIHDHPLIPRLELHVVLHPGAYAAELAPARTFCFEHEVNYLRSQGLARGGTLDNAVVIGKDRFYTSAEGLRFPDEFVRHKILDLVGDLSLLGRPLMRLRIEAVRPGHAHNVAFAARLEEEAVKLRRPRHPLARRSA